MKNSNESLQSKKQPQMLNPIRLGFAVGSVVVLFYLGCMLTMATVSHGQAVTFSTASSTDWMSNPSCAKPFRQTRFVSDWSARLCWAGSVVLRSRGSTI